MVRICKAGGFILVQAWAFEQEETSKRRFERQDVFVPWHLRKMKESYTTVKTVETQHTHEQAGIQVHQRYCHMYKRGELEELCALVPGCGVVDGGYDSGNWRVLIQTSLMANEVD